MPKRFKLRDFWSTLGKIATQFVLVFLRGGADVSARWNGKLSLEYERNDARIHNPGNRYNLQKSQSVTPIRLGCSCAPYAPCCPLWYGTVYGTPLTFSNRFISVRTAIEYFDTRLSGQINALISQVDCKNSPFEKIGSEKVHIIFNHSDLGIY